ncbi:MAG TPA: hypothetical protein VIP46_05025 [Pyrinomonadaceae bacterium]
MGAAAKTVARDGAGGAARGRRAPTLSDLAAEVKSELGGEWLPALYRERVRTLRTRSFQLPAVSKGASDVEVQHTLLGVELRVGRRRVSCPDLATARYLAVFARAGCPEVAVPYDITKISRLADELERAWQRTVLLADHVAARRAQAFRTRLKKFIVEAARAEIAAEGAGAAVPAFNQNTRQRRRGA